jgi:hypothetical protein
MVCQTWRLVASSAWAQSPISAKLRKQPSHQPVVGFMTHIDKQGEGTCGCGSLSTREASWAKRL